MKNNGILLYTTWMNLISIHLNIKEYISSKSIYVKFQKKYYYVMIKIKIVVTLQGDSDWQGCEEGFWVPEMIAKFTCVFSLWH